MNKGVIMNKRIFRRSIAAVAISGAFALSGTALAVDEAEQNHPIPSAQVLAKSGDLSVVTGGASITGEISEIRNAANVRVPDLDFFSFYARAGDILNISIDSKSSANGFFVPMLTVLSGTPPSYTNLREQMGTLTVNPKIENFLVKETGIHVVAVSGVPCMLTATGATCKSMIVGSTALGRYSMSITPAVPPALQVEINIKPGSGETAPMNPKSKGNIPVALISNAQEKFYANQDVDVSSLRFGATGEEESLRRCDTAGVDVDGDGVLDMVCHFETEKAHFAEDSLEGVLLGKVKSGRAIEGHGRLKINMPKINLH
jgi:hypothetical protein